MKCTVTVARIGPKGKGHLWGYPAPQVLLLEGFVAELGLSAELGNRIGAATEGYVREKLYRDRLGIIKPSTLQGT